MPEPIPANSVRFTAPPANLLPDLRASINKALTALGPNEKGALVIVGTTDGAGVKFNAAVVAKVGKGWAIQGWVAKSWGKEVEGGAAVQYSWGDGG